MASRPSVALRVTAEPVVNDAPALCPVGILMVANDDVVAISQL